jgi:hypothetical protein
VDCVTPEGRLGHVQPIGAGPHGFDPKSTDMFAVGAFLLAGSKPPSSDGLSQPTSEPKSLRPPSARRTGGQPGHSGRTLRLVKMPDRTVRHPVDRCTGCGRSLAHQAPDRVERARTRSSICPSRNWR